ncbi:MAG: hypothetical protein U0840_10380 [Gemmataceae bacterium]
MQVGPDWRLTPERAAIHLPTATVVVADLHLGYDRVRQRSGEAIPFRSLEGELRPLRDLLAREGLHRLAIAGDLFEDPRRGRDELVADLCGWLEEVGAELVGVVPGNHDRGLAGAALPLAPNGLELGVWHIVHGDQPLPDGPVMQGHDHPSLRWGQAAGPCFLVSDRHVVLPAYSRDAAGVNVLTQRRWEQHRCVVVAGTELLDFGAVGPLRRRLRTDRS